MSENATSWTTRPSRIRVGDSVIVYLSASDPLYPITVSRGESLHTRFGQLRHEFLIDKKWGSRISCTAGHIFALRPSPDMWTRALPRRTQIIYTADISLIIQLLDLAPGSVVAESGTGSGSLSHALASAVFPNGHLYTHDIDESRVKLVEKYIQEHGLADVTTAVVQNVCETGFFVENACDAVFLDLPAPWTAAKAALRALSSARGGRIVSFSPCIEQVQRMCEALRTLGFVNIETVELVPRNLKVVRELRNRFDLSDEKASQPPSTRDGNRKRPHAATEETRDDGQDEKTGESGATTVAPHKQQQQHTLIVFPSNQPTHTGYLTSATLLPRGNASTAAAQIL